MGASIYGNVGGVARKAKELYGDVGGVTRKLKSASANVGGVTRKIYSGYQCQAGSMGHFGHLMILDSGAITGYMSTNCDEYTNYHNYAYNLILKFKSKHEYTPNSPVVSLTVTSSAKSWASDFNDGLNNYIEISTPRNDGVYSNICADMNYGIDCTKHLDFYPEKTGQADSIWLSFQMSGKPHYDDGVESWNNIKLYIDIQSGDLQIFGEPITSVELI